MRETVDEQAARERLVELGAQRSLDAICEKAWLYKVLDDLDDAIEHANQAVRLARFTGVRRDQLQPRILRASVMQARGEHPAAAHELTLCADDARTHNWRRLEALAFQQRGRGSFEMKEYAAAVDDFLSALRLREEVGASDEYIETSRFALEVARSFATTGGPITLMRRHDRGASQDSLGSNGNAPDTARPTAQSPAAQGQSTQSPSTQSSSEQRASTPSSAADVPLFEATELPQTKRAAEPIFARFRRRAAEHKQAAEQQTSTPDSNGRDDEPSVRVDPLESEGAVHYPAEPASASDVSGADAAATLWAAAARTPGPPVVPGGSEAHPDRDSAATTFDDDASRTTPADEAVSDSTQTRGTHGLATAPVPARHVANSLHADAGLPTTRKQRRDLLWGRFNAADPTGTSERTGDDDAQE